VEPHHCAGTWEVDLVLDVAGGDGPAHALTEGRSRGTGFGYDYGMMPTYYVSLSLTRPPNAPDSDILELLRRAAEGATCVVIEVSAAGLLVRCEAESLNVLEETIRTEFAARGGSLNYISIQPI
jgi:hypothetical protein